MVSESKSISQDLLKGLRLLEYRGYDSWGVSMISNHKIATQKSITSLSDGENISLPDAQVGIGHTRWATHGGVSEINAHPHLNSTKSLALVHNGVVENHQQLRETITALGYDCTSQTDSELIVHLVDHHLKDQDLVQAVHSACSELEGCNAVVVLDLTSNALVASKSGSPLVVGFDDAIPYQKLVCIASDQLILSKHCSTVQYISDGQALHVSQEGVSMFDQNLKHIEFSPQPLEKEASDLSTEGYPHFTLKEINEQPQVIKNLVTEKHQEVKQLTDLISQFSHLNIIGCGTAYFMSLFGEYLFSQTSTHSAKAIAGSEAEYLLFPEKLDQLPLFLSQSGETMDSIIQAKKYAQLNKDIAAILNRPNSTLDRLSTQSYHLEAGPEIGVASTKAVTAKMTTMLLVVAEMLGQGEHIHQALLESVDHLQHILSSDSTKAIRKTTQYLAKSEHIFVIGSGVVYPIALETALKIKELSYIHAEGFAGGELKHGALALIEEGTPCIVLARNNEDDVLTNAQEVKARGGYLIGITPEDNEVFDEVLLTRKSSQQNQVHSNLPDFLQHGAQLLVHTVIGQLLAYYCTLELGHNPDKPRNLAKSVTVK